MTYDDTARKLAVKVIGTVESNLDYTSVNFNDPITVGIAQWYGSRAANVLERMRTTNPDEWYGVQPSIANQLATISSSDSWWNSRYLTQSEGDSLRGAMSRNQAVQNQQLTEDLEIYKNVAISYNWDPDAHTDTTIYFFSMHHQGPAYALEVILNLDTECTLEQMHAECLNHPVLGQYGSRYRTTYDLIKVADLSGVDPAPVDPGPAPTPTNGNAKHIKQQGDLLLVTFDNAETITFYPNGTGLFTPRKGKLPDPVPAPTQPPEPPQTGQWYHPAPGTQITSPYGPRGFDGFHYGCDFSSTTAPTGVDIIAVTDLIVTVAYNAYTGGNATAGGYVKGHTTDGAYTFSYNHMAPNTVIPNKGDTIAAGSKIGVEGQTGNVTGTHLHFECYEGALNDPWAPPYGNPIDPLPVLRAHGVAV